MVKERTMDLITYEGIHHVSFVVSNLQVSKAFYSSVLNVQEIERPNFNFPGAWFQAGQQQIHLIEYKDALRLPKGWGIDTRDHHVALRVKDYHEALAHLKAQHIEVVESPNSRSGFAQIFCCDPDGNIIELNVDQADL
jgi:glyoxylase I family protein